MVFSILTEQRFSRNDSNQHFVFSSFVYVQVGCRLKVKQAYITLSSERASCTVFNMGCTCPKCGSRLQFGVTILHTTCSVMNSTLMSPCYFTLWQIVLWKSDINLVFLVDKALSKVVSTFVELTGTSTVYFAIYLLKFVDLAILLTIFQNVFILLI